MPLDSQPWNRILNGHTTSHSQEGRIGNHMKAEILMRGLAGWDPDDHVFLGGTGCCFCGHSLSSIKAV